ncbi:MAG: hypothetical protein ACTIDE_09990 [Carnobacterium maltaromaticum]
MGGFKKGSTGQIIIEGLPPLKFTLTEVTKNKSFSNASKAPFGEIVFIHEIIKDEKNFKVKHSVSLLSETVTQRELGILTNIFAPVPSAVLGLKMKLKSNEFESEFADNNKLSAGFSFIKVYNVWSRKIKLALKEIDLTHPQFIILTATGDLL